MDSFSINIIDIVAVVLILLITIVSAKKGFMKTLLTLGAVIVSFIGARIAAIPVAEFIYSDYLSSFVLEKLNELLPNGSVAGELEAVFEGILAQFPAALVDIARTYNLLPDLSSLAGSTADLTVASIEELYIAPVLTEIAAIITTLVLFVILSAILRLVVAVINKFFVSDKHKFVKRTNMLLGAVLGFVKSLIPVGVLCAILNIAAPAIGNEQLMSFVSTSYFCQLVADLF